MNHNRKFFTPGNVDEQVDQLSLNSKATRLSQNKRPQEPVQAEESLVQDLQAYYQTEQQKDAVSLEQAWQRVSARVAGDRESPHPADKPLWTDNLRFSQERTRTMRNQASTRPQGRKFLRRLSMLAAVLFVALLVGSMALVLNLTHQRTTIGAFTASHTPTPAITNSIGRTISTKKGEFGGFSWSPDSKRVAASVYDTTTTHYIRDSLEIWDAADGKHLVIVPMPGGSASSDAETPLSLDWSPNSQLVAVATIQHVLIVDSQSGKIVRSYAPKLASVVTTSSTGTSPLASLFPASGPGGFDTTAWSPDGRLMASSWYSGASGGIIQVWNPQTGEVVFNLPAGGTYNIGDLAWSSDGQYIAANVWNTQPNYNSSASAQDLFIGVWNVSTHQLVSRIPGSSGSSMLVHWQPSSHNLAFANSFASFSHVNIQIWNATTGKPVKQYAVPAQDTDGRFTLAWSPDGKYLAYVGLADKNSNETVNLLDVNSGQTTYGYKGHVGHITALAWSPDGKYIVSCDSSAAKVWLASGQ